jgi:hypothetical protein
MLGGLILPLDGDFIPKLWPLALQLPNKAKTIGKRSTISERMAIFRVHAAKTRLEVEVIIHTVIATLKSIGHREISSVTCEMSFCRCGNEFGVLIAQSGSWESNPMTRIATYWLLK